MSKQTDAQLIKNFLEKQWKSEVLIRELYAQRDELLKALQSIYADQLAAAVLREREECAKECERMVLFPGGRQEAHAHSSVWDAAKAIRARGGK